MPTAKKPKTGRLTAKDVPGSGGARLTGVRKERREEQNRSALELARSGLGVRTRKSRK